METQKLTLALTNCSYRGSSITLVCFASTVFIFFFLSPKNALVTEETLRQIVTHESILYQWGTCEYVMLRCIRSHPSHSGLRIGTGWEASQPPRASTHYEADQCSVFLFFSFGLVGSNCVGLNWKRTRIIPKWNLNGVPVQKKP